VSNVIGSASDFYRLRVTRIDVTDEPELDWRDDILYRDAPVEVTDEEEDWRLEAVCLEDDCAHEIAQFTEQDQALALLEGVQDDLNEMTKSAFEDRYLKTAGPRFTDDVPVVPDDDTPEDQGKEPAGHSEGHTT
jgi:hypothetical protein